MRRNKMDFYDGADFTDHKKTVQDLLKSIPEENYCDWLLVQKSSRIWAAFSTPGSFLIPSCEPTYTVREFLEL